MGYIMKRMNVLLLVLFISSYTVWGQTGLRSVIENGNLSALNNVIERNELWDLTQDELRILRNTIYAKYGYSFSSVDLQIYFSRFDWYSGTNTNVDNLLSEIDKENIVRIQNFERLNVEFLLFQDTIFTWIQEQGISFQKEIISFNGINLYHNPVLYSELPESLSTTYYTTAFCFAMGRFLIPSETERIIKNIGNNRINRAIIFNPSVLFLNSRVFGRVYRPFQETGTFLLVFPYDGSRPYSIQSNQIINNSAKNFLILPWSVEYYLYKITSDGGLELVDEVHAN